MREPNRSILLSAAGALAFLAAPAAMNQPPPGLGPAVAHAAGAGLEKASKVLALNREAMELYDELEFELARRALEDAVSLIRDARLQDHLVAAKTYGNLGVLFAGGFKDPEQAARHFQAALAVKSDFDLPGPYRTPEAVAALEAARSGGESASSEALPPAAPVSATAEANRAKGASDLAVLRCPTSGEAFSGGDVTLRCVTTPGFRPAAVVLHYKQQGRGEFKQLPMRPKTTRNNKALWSASIPAREVGGKWLPFYFEARDDGGQTLARSGRYESPSILTVKGGDAGVRASARGRRHDDDADERDEEDQDEGEGEGEGGNDEENPLLKDKQARGHKRRGKFFVSLGVGTGGGYAADPGVEAYRDYSRSFTPGLAFGGAGHVLPEIGYMVTSTFALSLQARLQYIPRPDTVTAGGAVAGLARALFFSGTGPGRFYGILSAGGGEGFRLKVEAVTNDRGVVQDTVRGGPFVGGAGAGYTHDLGKTFEFMLESNLLAGAPDFSLAFDINAGLRALF